VKASDFVEVSGTSANGRTPSRLKFETSGTGNAGELTINTGRLVVQNRGQVSVSGTVSGTQAGASGDLDIEAGSIFLNNQGQLIAKTASGEGGNIRLRVQDSIVMRYNSEISTEAGRTGNGGNINIEAGGFVLAILSENSDIVANAFQGRGGNARATATGVFGFRQFQGRRTPESDFTASSELGIDGVVTINTRDNPRLVALPQNVLNEQIVQVCPSRGEQVAQHEFIVTGRGGLPDNPHETLSNDAVWTDLRPMPQTTTRSSSQDIKLITHSQTVPFIEAQGWMINDQGQVVLTAEASTVTPQSSRLTSAQCQGR
jgi:large exoprotein involved in heme utilization and adhesion